MVKPSNMLQDMKGFFIHFTKIQKGEAGNYLNGKVFTGGGLMKSLDGKKGSKECYMCDLSNI
jgi:hypothetical protein